MGTEQTPENSNVSAAPTPKTVIKEFSKNWPLRAHPEHFKQFSHGLHFIDKPMPKQQTCLVSRFVKLHQVMLSWPQSLVELIMLKTSGPSMLRTVKRRKT